jgi:hypothetical protein
MICSRRFLGRVSLRLVVLVCLLLVCLLVAAPVTADIQIRAGSILAVAGFADDHVLLNFSDSGELLGQVEIVDPNDILGSPQGLTWLASGLWIAGATSVHQIDPSTGELSNGFEVVPGPTLTALCSDGENLLVGGFVSETFLRFDVAGNPLGGITLDSPSLFLVGGDSDADLLYVPSHSTGDVHVFDLSGTAVDVIQTDQISDLTAVALDPEGETFWVATGTGLNDILQFDFDGTLLESFPGVVSGIMGLAIVPVGLFADGFESGDSSAWTDPNDGFSNPPAAPSENLSAVSSSPNLADGRPARKVGLRPSRSHR